MTILDSKQVEKFYDAFGKKQDKQFYENVPVSALIVHGEFDTANSVYEFGCGTGKLAKNLLENHLNSECKYFGVDISSTMIEICRDRLLAYQNRAECVRGDLLTDQNLIKDNIDRFVATYVLDLLSDGDIDTVLERAYGMLNPGGYLCVAGLTNGNSLISKFVASFWKVLYKIRPMLVGGCRPVNVSERLSSTKWEILFSRTIASFGVPSEVLVARKRA